MDSHRFERIRALFHAACELPADERSAFVEANCADAALRADVVALLEADSTGRDALADSGPAIGRRLLAERRGEVERGIPRKIGPYEVIRLIGEGGMGAVYEAEQQSPKRTVAIKVLRTVSPSRALERRFEHEAFILGRLQHAGIAQIFEAGREALPGGERLYLVMELVRGRNLIQYADGEKLSVRQRIELFVRVCEAVQHAHQKGVIHRDLKPANILVTDDGTDSGSWPRSGSVVVGGQPKILDFGIARLTEADVHLTQHTFDGQLLGTLHYMSPEQVVGDPNEIDTRSDVYALGVLLHELLAGRLPYDVRNRSVLEAARMIREATPDRLGTVDTALRGDLETIAGKALEKDKARRYQSAAELAADLRAYLEGAPISARRDSRWYLLQNTLRRYRLAASLIGVLAVLAAASAITFAVLYQRANAAAGTAAAALARAREATLTAEAERDRATAAERQARQQARRSERMTNFLTDVLNAADPRAVGHDATVIDALAYAAQNVERELADDPETRAHLYAALSEMYGRIGRFDEAFEFGQASIDLFRELGPEGSPVLATILGHYGALLSNFRRPQEGLAYQLESLAMHRQFLPPDAPDIGMDLTNVGATYRLLGDLGAAERYTRESIALYQRATLEQPEHYAGFALAWNGLAALLYSREEWDEAAAAAEEALGLLERIGSRSHPYSVTALNALAAAERARGNIESARSANERVLELALELYGPDNPDTAQAYLSLAQFERLQGNYPRAAELFRAALEIRRKLFPPGHPEFGYPLSGLAAALLKLGRAAEAEPLLREAYAIRSAGEPEAVTTGMTAADFGAALVQLGCYEEAEAPLLSAYELLSRHRGPTSDSARYVIEQLLTLYEATGQPDRVKAWRRRLPG